MKQLKIKLLPGGVMPKYAKPGDSGMDLYARIDNEEKSIKIAPGRSEVIPCGFALELEEGWEAQVRPRSGGVLEVRLGTIDSGYRGEIGARISSLLPNAYLTVFDGDRIAQLVIAPVARVELVEVEELSKSERGENGWGSTGSR